MITCLLGTVEIVSSYSCYISHLALHESSQDRCVPTLANNTYIRSCSPPKVIIVLHGCSWWCKMSPYEFAKVLLCCMKGRWNQSWNRVGSCGWKLKRSQIYTFKVRYQQARTHSSSYELWNVVCSYYTFVNNASKSVYMLEHTRTHTAWLYIIAVTIPRSSTAQWWCRLHLLECLWEWQHVPASHRSPLKHPPLLTGQVVRSGSHAPVTPSSTLRKVLISPSGP